MKQFGLLGFPLGHSMSPFIHRELFSLLGEEADYRLYSFDPDNVEKQIPSLFSLDGFNITIPYKQTVVPFLDRLDESASRYRSVNTVITGKNGGEKVGYNTDVYGFLSTVQMMGASLEGDVLLLGAGGSGRMMAVETLLAGGHLTLAVRDAESKNTRSLLAFLQELFPQKKYTLTGLDQIHGHYDILLNSTPSGMYPKVDEIPVSEEVVAGVRYVFDAIYNPEETLLIKAAKRHGVTASSGMPMLVRQAVRAQEIWFGRSFAEEDILALIQRSNREMEAKFQK